MYNSCWGKPKTWGQSPPPTKSVSIPNKESSGDMLESLARECQKRGNRLEVMNGKVYEVSRKLIGELK